MEKSQSATGCQFWMSPDTQLTLLKSLQYQHSPQVSAPQGLWISSSSHSEDGLPIHLMISVKKKGGAGLWKPTLHGSFCKAVGVICHFTVMAEWKTSILQTGRTLDTKAILHGFLLLKHSTKSQCLSWGTRHKQFNACFTMVLPLFFLSFLGLKKYSFGMSILVLKSYQVKFLKRISKLRWPYLGSENKTHKRKQNKKQTTITIISNKAHDHWWPLSIRWPNKLSIKKEAEKWCQSRNLETRMRILIPKYKARD